MKFGICWQRHDSPIFAKLILTPNLRLVQRCPAECRLFESRYRFLRAFSSVLTKLQYLEKICYQLYK